MRIKKLALAFSIVGLIGAGLVWTRTSSADAPKKKEVTFNKDVAPILYKNCDECHKPNDIAPMSLINYKDARPWAQSIREMVLTKQMPPWSAKSDPGEFTNDRRLSQEEIDTITSWVDQGAKEGDAKDLPKPPGFTQDGWLLGEPDVVLSMDKPYAIPANGPDEYIYFTIPTNFTEDKWITAAEIKPGNKKVVHHIIAFLISGEQYNAFRAVGGRPHRQSDGNSIFYQDGTLNRVRMDAPVDDDTCAHPQGRTGGGLGEGGGNLGNLLAGYAPGKDVDSYPAGYAKKIPAGSYIVFQVHYSNFRGGLNKPETDLSSVGLHFAKTPPSEMKKMIVTRGVSNTWFRLPAGDPDHQVVACMTFDKDVQMLTYMPHMHLRGKDMRYDLILPDGRKETLLEVPKFSFNWQTVYKLKEPLEIPKGSKLVVTAHFDNSERNKYNPDPKKDVRWGDPTYDEMMIGWVDYAVDRPKDRIVAKLDPKIYDSYVGQYQFGPGFSLVITREGDQLMGQATGQPKVQFYPESETKFFLKVIEGELTFVKNEKGEVTEVVFNMNGKLVHGKKAPAVTTAKATQTASR
ncbi:MAG TPA: DUF3471 domain-containing protein [Blastocatellia bacterium]|nr:DUF3471 domain-containing protein [Blastocatellia bacterium]